MNLPSWNASDYHAHASAQTGWGRELHARLTLSRSETLFDLGCGDGRLSAALATRVPSGHVVGFDADPDMIAFARQRYAQPNLEFVQSDIRAFAHARRADVIVSTACLHWIAEYESVLSCCQRHLRPGGRLFFQMGGRGNCADVWAAARSVAAEAPWAEDFPRFELPWHFRGPEEYAAALPRHGFHPERCALVDKDMVHACRDELGNWMRTTWMPILQRLDETRRPDFVRAVLDRYLSAHPLDAQGRTHVAMVRLEVEATALGEAR